MIQSEFDHEDLESIDAWEFLKGVDRRAPGSTLYMAPEFGWPYIQMVNLLSAYAASRKNPFPLLNTYPWEDRVLPRYSFETIQMMIQQDWIKEIKVFAMTTKAFNTLQRELKDYGLPDIPVTLEKEISKL